MFNEKDDIKLTDTKSTKEDRERSKREDLTSISPLPQGLAKRLWEKGDR